MCPVCRMLQHPANRTHNPQLWAYWCPKHAEQAIRSAIKTSVASSWHFIFTYQVLFFIQGLSVCATGNKIDTEQTISGKFTNIQGGLISP